MRRQLILAITASILLATAGCNLMEKSQVEVVIESESKASITNSLVILLGQPVNHEEIRKIFHRYRIPDLTDLAPGPEGFLLRKFGPDLVIAAGTDDRGCLYAAGALLRRIDFSSDHISIPEELNLRTAPAFEIRGTQYGQSGVAKRLSQVRDWTETETQRVILDYALAGANIFSTRPGPLFDFINY